jgi:subtilisin-like proprotein convertase family protein
MKLSKLVHGSFLSAPMILALSATAADPVSYEVSSGGGIQGGGQSIFEFNVTDDIRVESLDLRLALHHFEHAELTAILRAPDGLTQITLFDGFRAGEVEFRDATFTDHTSITMDSFTDTDGKWIYLGSIRPRGDNDPNTNDQLSVFNGMQATGTWQLVILDEAIGEDGTVYKAGETAPWGVVAGTTLIITPIPEPTTFALLGITAFGFISRRFVGARK